MSPRSESENKKIREQRIEHIIQVSLELLALQGYHKTAISEIAKKAGISKGLMYNYFSSKQDLLIAVVQFNYQQATDILFGLVMEKALILPPKELKIYGVEMFFKMMVEMADIWKLSISLSMQVSNMPEVQAIMQKIFFEGYERLSMLMVDPNSDNIQAEAKLLAAMLDGIALHYYLIGDTYDITSVKKVLISNLFG